MIKAVLLDLDDTLLRVETRHFGRRYVDALVAFFLERYPHFDIPEIITKLRKAIREAVRATVGNLDPTLTNGQTFNAALARYFPELPFDAWKTLFEEYHEGTYRSLRETTQQIAAARSLIERLNKLNLMVVIATNPIFPAGAVKDRLKWAGIDDLNYALVTNVDEMHFTKPHPHFYEEIAARVGFEADEAIMVGDDVQNDIIPASHAGMNTFWIDWGETWEEYPGGTGSAFLDGKGTLADLERLVSEDWLNTLNARPRTPEQVEPRMLGNTAALYNLITNINPAYWNMRPDPNEWSPLETICHLRDSEKYVQRPRLQRIANEDNPFISQPTPPPGPGESNLSGEDGFAALREFWDQRCETITYLRTLNKEDWNRPARHSIFGPTTLLEMAHFTTRHDHLHINQLCWTIGRCKQL